MTTRTEAPDMTGTRVRVTAKYARSIRQCRKLGGKIKVKEPVTGLMYNGKVISRWMTHDAEGKPQYGNTALLGSPVGEKK